MSRISPRAIAIGFAATALLAAPALAQHHGTPSGPTSVEIPGFAWDAAASAELDSELHRLHQIWNTGDIGALRQYILGDPAMPTFELDPRTHRPIRLVGKAQIDAFIDDVINAEATDGLRAELETPVTVCRATSTVGVCTEECTVRYRNASGRIVAEDRLRSTQIAVRTSEGWRWIQWQMADARPPLSISAR